MFHSALPLTRNATGRIDIPSRDGSVVLTRFWRKVWGPDTLWLWVMPMPPDGTVTERVLARLRFRGEGHQ